MKAGSKLTVTGSLAFDGLGVHAWEMPIERYDRFILVSL